MSTIASHSPLNISEVWFQRATNRKWPMGPRGHVTDNVTWPIRSNSWPQYT